LRDVASLAQGFLRNADQRAEPVVEDRLRPERIATAPVMRGITGIPAPKASAPGIAPHAAMEPAARVLPHTPRTTGSRFSCSGVPGLSREGRFAT
jgi:hypothetical protein